MGSLNDRELVEKVTIKRPMAASDGSGSFKESLTTIKTGAPARFDQLRDGFTVDVQGSLVVLNEVVYLKEAVQPQDEVTDEKTGTKYRAVVVRTLKRFDGKINHYEVVLRRVA